MRPRATAARSKESEPCLVRHGHLLVNGLEDGHLGARLLHLEVLRCDHPLHAVFSGGGDRGGQPSNELLFGLGAATGSAEVTVRYRSGEIDQFTTAVDTTVVAMEDQPVVLKPNTKNDPNPVFSYELAPGMSTWVFRWRTVGIKGDLAQDVVHVENHLQYEASDPCHIGIAPGAVRDLKLNDPGVAHTVYRSGEYWQHEVRWGTLPCQEGCSYRFWVTSGLGNGVTASSTPKLITPIDFCIPELPPE